jgi:hypothetical protein
MNTATITLGITKQDVEHLYSEHTDGILILKNIVYSLIPREGIVAWHKEKGKGFVRKDEKYIENNQEVSLVFNDEFEKIHEVENDVERKLHTLYLHVRAELEKHSSMPFIQGDRLETKLIKYPISKLGVSAHKDLSSNINCVVLMDLYGSANFYTADDKQRTNEKCYRVGPGDIVIMRGPRNSGESHLRPTHYVLDIEEERLVFVCREIEDSVEQIVNKDNWRGF